VPMSPYTTPSDPSAKAQKCWPVCPFPVPCTVGT